MEISDDLDREAIVFLDALLPDGAVPTVLIAVAAFLDENGDECWRCYCNSEAPCSTNVGLLEMAKLQIISRTETGINFGGDE